jgi:acyl-CoA synthetase (AMP-forming)/AMP-acid ligase II
MSSYRSTDTSGTVLGTGVDYNDWDKIETDADGKSVGLSAPVYSPGPSNDLYTSGWSFGSLNTGQYMAHVVDGIHVPAEFMWNRVGNRHGSLNLDLLFFSAAASQREIVLRKRVRRPGTGMQIRIVDDDGSEELSPWTSTSEPSIGESFQRIVYKTNWAINWSVIPQQQAQETDYLINLNECTSFVSGFLQDYARRDGTGSVNVFSHVKEILDFAAAGYSPAQAAFAIANAIQETAWFTAIVEPDGPGAPCHNYPGGCEYRGRGYTHLTLEDNYLRIGEMLGVGDLFVLSPDLVGLEFYRVLTMDAYFRRAGILDLLASSPNYLEARRRVNPNESQNKKIKGAKVSRSLGDRISRLATGMADIIKRCRLFNR